MKLLHRIQALDASRRLDVVNNYIPALLVHEDHTSSENDKTIVVGHIHSNLVEAIRKEIDKIGDAIPNRELFLLPPPDVGQKLPSSCVGKPSNLIRNRFFGLLICKNPDQDPPITLTDTRSEALECFTDLLLKCKIISKRHTDMYPITDLRKPGGDIIATINRNAAPYLGITSTGVNLLCYVRDDTNDGVDGDNKSGRHSNVSLWLAQRAANKSHNALRWDPTVAGGQPASLSHFENVVKEAGEEAGIDADLVIKRAVSTGCLSQMTCKPDGTCMKPSLYYTWDMQVDRETFVPVPADGEVSVFELCSANQLEYEVRHGDRLRPAMILVVTDFLIRHGVITSDNEPDYNEIILAMHRERFVLEYDI